MCGMVKDIIAKNNTLYLIVVKQVWDKIVSGEKTIEYREVTDYWTKRINARHYDYLKISNGYGNKTRPYRLYRYAGATRVMKNSIQHFSIPISKSLIIEQRDYVDLPNDFSKKNRVNDVH
jgi:hypothetical protein